MNGDVVAFDVGACTGDVVAFNVGECMYYLPSGMFSNESSARSSRSVPSARSPRSSFSLHAPFARPSRSVPPTSLSISHRHSVPSLLRKRNPTTRVGGSLILVVSNPKGWTEFSGTSPTVSPSHQSDDPVTADIDLTQVKAHASLSTVEFSPVAEASLNLPPPLPLSPEEVGEISSETPRTDVPAVSALPSLGSVHHSTSQCTPCIYFKSKGVCLNEKGCNYCHFEHPGKKSKRLRPPKHVRERIPKRQAEQVSSEVADEGLKVCE